MRPTTLSGEEIAARGTKIYEDTIRSKVEQGGLKSQSQLRLAKVSLESSVGENIAGKFQWVSLVNCPWERSPSDAKSSYDGRA